MQNEHLVNLWKKWASSSEKAKNNEIPLFSQQAGVWWLSFLCRTFCVFQSCDSVTVTTLRREVLVLYECVEKREHVGSYKRDLLPCRWTKLSLTPCVQASHVRVSKPLWWVRLDKLFEIARIQVQIASTSGYWEFYPAFSVVSLAISHHLAPRGLKYNFLKQPRSEARLQNPRSVLSRLSGAVLPGTVPRAEAEAHAGFPAVLLNCQAFLSWIQMLQLFKK